MSVDKNFRFTSLLLDLYFLRSFLPHAIIPTDKARIDINAKGSLFKKLGTGMMLRFSNLIRMRATRHKTKMPMFAFFLILHL